MEEPHIFDLWQSIHLRATTKPMKLLKAKRGLTIREALK
jgi:hypothetical protein